MNTSPQALALAGLRVLEVGTGPALAYAGKLCADFGAEVIKVEAPAGDAWRALPPLLPADAFAPDAAAGAATDGPGQSALFAWLNTHKRSVAADLQCADDRAWLAQLASTCDLVLDARALDQGLDVLAQPVFGLPDTAHQRAAGLSHCPVQVVLTWFGETGPYSRFQGSEAVCRALSGAVHASGPRDGPPHQPHELQTGVIAGLAAFSAAVAALTGRGQGSRRFVISIHEAVFGTVEMEAGMVQDKRHPGRIGVNRFCGTHPTGIYRTADGWLGLFTHTLPQWAALCQALGRPAWAHDPGLANGALRMARADEIDDWLQQALLQRTAAEWFEQLGALKHPTVLVPTMAELLQQDVHRTRGAFVPVQAGRVVLQAPVVPLRLGDAGPLPGGPVAALGADNAWSRGPALQHRPQQLLQPAPADDVLPLQGLRIIDLTMGWAGPLASRTAADFGAELIKVESTTYPDWWRGAHFTDEFYRERLYEKNSNFNLMNRHKRGITLDLTQPQGRQLLLQLVAGADALIENYSAEVLPKLGLTYEALRAVNPRLVMVSMPAFGLDNAWSHTRAYGGTLEQASGLPLYTGHADGPPAMTSYAYGDPVGGFNAGAALLLALWTQRRSGQGRHLNLSQVEAMLTMTAPWLLEQQLAGHVGPRQGNRHPLWAPHGLYRCAGDDAWLALSVRDDGQWQRLCAVLARPDLAADTALASAAGRRAQHDALDAAIHAWTALHGADDAMARLQAAGVAAGVVRSMAALLHDPHLHARGFWQPATRPFAGTYTATTCWFRSGPDALPTRSLAPTLGEHNHAVLGDGPGGVLGLSAAQIQALEDAGVCGQAAVRKQPAGPTATGPTSTGPASTGPTS